MLKSENIRLKGNK